MALKRLVLGCATDICVDKHRCGYLAFSPWEGITQKLSPDWHRLILSAMREGDALYLSDSALLSILKAVADVAVGYVRQTNEIDEAYLVSVLERYIPDATYGKWGILNRVLVAKALVALRVISVTRTPKSDPVSFVVVNDPITPLFTDPKSVSRVSLIEKVVLTKPIASATRQFEDACERLSLKRADYFGDPRRARISTSAIIADIRNILSDWVIALNEARSVIAAACDTVRPLVFRALTTLGECDDQGLLNVRSAVAKYVNTFVGLDALALSTATLGSTEKVSARSLIDFKDLWRLFEEGLGSSDCPVEVVNSSFAVEAFDCFNIGPGDPLTNVPYRAVKFAGDDTANAVTLIASRWTEDTSLWNVASAADSGISAPGSDPATIINKVIGKVSDSLLAPWVYSVDSPYLDTPTDKAIDLINDSLYTADVRNALIESAAIVSSRDIEVMAEGDSVHIGYSVDATQQTGTVMSSTTVSTSSARDALLYSLSARRQAGGAGMGVSLYKKPSLSSVIKGRTLSHSPGVMATKLAPTAILSQFANWDVTEATAHTASDATLTLQIYGEDDFDAVKASPTYVVRQLVGGVPRRSRATYLIEFTPGMVALSARLASFLNLLVSAPESQRINGVKLGVMKALYAAVPITLRQVVEQEYWGAMAAPTLAPDTDDDCHDSMLLAFNCIVNLGALLQALHLDALGVAIIAATKDAFAKIDELSLGLIR